MSTSTSLSTRFAEIDERRLLLLVTFVPLVAFFVVVWAIPILYALGMSLFSDPTGASVFVGLENYTAILATPAFLTFLWNSVVYAVSTTVFSLLLGLALALVVNQQIKGGNVLRTMMIFPYLLPTLVVIFIWQFLFDPNLGVINQWLLGFGVIEEPIAFFSTLEWAMPAVAITSVWKFGSFAFFILLARLQIGRAHV